MNIVTIIKTFIKPKTLIREKIIATKVGIHLILETPLTDTDRQVLENTMATLENMRQRYDSSIW